MGLIILIAVGAVTGWLASLMLRPANRPPAGYNMLVAIFGALVAGILTYPESVLTGIGAASLGFAFCGAIVALILFHSSGKQANH